MTTTDTLLADLADVLDRASKLAKDLSATLAGPSVDMLKPAYHPERMGYVCEIRCGDRVLFAGGWREVATWFNHANGVVTVTFTDPDMDALVDKGTHAIRIQKSKFNRVSARQGFPERLDVEAPIPIEMLDRVTFFGRVFEVRERNAMRIGLEEVKG